MTAARQPYVLQSDCSRCAALCCIAFPAEKSPGFAVSKAGGEPCPHLDTCGACAIYDERAESGFAGCLQFECFGAGQRVVQGLFNGRSWQDEPDLLEPMIEAFLTSRKACELLFLVSYARGELAEGADLAQLDEWEARLDAIASTGAGPGIAAELDGIERHLRSLFTAIKPPESLATSSW
jgi:hypothetical protein